MDISKNQAALATDVLSNILVALPSNKASLVVGIIIVIALVCLWIYFEN